MNRSSSHFINHVTNLPVTEAIDRVEQVVQNMGMHVFARINHSAGAESVDMPLRPTQLILFGHPLGGTPLMQVQQTIGLELPLKILAWQDESGQSWLSYPNISQLAKLHNVEVDESVTRLQDVLSKVISVVNEASH